MIDGLSPTEIDWLKAFFSSPNEFDWNAIETDTLPPAIADQLRPWLRVVARGTANTSAILPFMRNGEITGWYATTCGPEGGFELASEIEALLGPSYLSTFESVPIGSSDAMATAMRGRFGGMVFRFTGPDPQSNARIADKIADYAALLNRRPPPQRRVIRPVGSIRADFERALLAQDEGQAEAMIAELRETGRLNEENLHYLDVRLKAGLGLWPQIARNHWLVATMSDLALPPQILADIVEALYRTYIEGLEPAGDLSALLAAFDAHIVQRYPRLFASRCGIRAPRVVKAFLLYERLQPRPNPLILENLAGLLNAPERQTPWLQAILTRAQDEPPAPVAEADAEEAFDDAQYDRAFEFFLALPLTKKSISRLLYCVSSIGTDEVRAQLLGRLDDADTALIGALTPNVRQKIDELRSKQPDTSPPPAPTLSENEWIRWANQLRTGTDLHGAELAVANAVASWDIVPFSTSAVKSKELADLLGNLNGDAASLVRRSIPQIFGAFFPPGEEASPTTKPLAAMLFMLIAMDESLSRVDLDLLAQLLARLLEFGLSSDEYEGLIGDLDEIQTRMGSYAHLPWSLDVCEILAVAPAASEAAREARLRFFLQVVGQAQGFAHRLGPPDLLPIGYLAQDYGVVPEALAGLNRTAAENAAEKTLPDLAGKTIGIYTLAEAAGSRAKQTLEQLFPGCKIAVNSDLVCTAQLASLAKAADLFIFAWKSSSHQAFYCVKDALPTGEPIWAQGKGTASIVRAVMDSIS